MYRGLKETRNARVIYLDMNSFFASVEQQLHPELRGKPVGVVSHVGPAGTILAASYEAKAFGLHTGMRLKEGWRLCPQLITPETTPGAYRATHTHFMTILRNIFGPEVQARSVDEAALFLPPNWQSSDQAWRIALEIKRRFRLELGEYIRCSIGIAPNSLLAKVATDLQKPDGLVEITLENLPSILEKLPLTALPGIAMKNAAHLESWGIKTPLDFYNSSPSALRQRFGIWGQYWWWRLHGYEPDDHNGHLKSMSHQHALKKWVDNPEVLRNILYRMADRLIHRLRRNHFRCRSVFLYLSLVDHPGFMAEQHFTAHTSNYVLLLKTFNELFEQLPDQLPSRIRKIAVGFNQLIAVESGWQLDLFHEQDRSESLSKALEKIRSRYGFEAIQRGNVIALDRRLAAEQLGFGRIKDI